MATRSFSCADSIYLAAGTASLLNWMSSDLLHAQYCCRLHAFSYLPSLLALWSGAELADRSLVRCPPPRWNILPCLNGTFASSQDLFLGRWCHLRSCWPLSDLALFVGICQSNVASSCQPARPSCCPLMHCPKFSTCSSSSARRSRALGALVASPQGLYLLTSFRAVFCPCLANLWSSCASRLDLPTFGCYYRRLEALLWFQLPLVIRLGSILRFHYPLLWGSWTPCERPRAKILQEVQERAFPGCYESCALNLTRCCQGKVGTAQGSQNIRSRRPNSPSYDCNSHQ